MLSLGIDLGGTKIEVALVSHAAAEREVIEVIERRRIATPSDDGYAAILEAVASLLEDCAKRAKLDLASVPIGIGMPGAVERRTGLVKNSNTTCLNGKPFRSDLRERMRRELCFDNDANCFALAETVLGAARAHRDHGVVFGVILGTGVGGGVVIDGTLWEGLHGIAGEWGHHSLYAGAPDARPCYCGKRGCVEAHLSGPALEQRYLELAGQARALPEIAARAPFDPHARTVIEELIAAFGRGLANVIDILDPSAIVLGGGVSNLELLYAQGRARVATELFNDELLTPIVKNQLGDSAGVLGAALLPLRARPASRGPLARSRDDH